MSETETETEIGRRERTLVDMKAPEDVKYWTEQFGATASELGDAVKAVGGSVATVQAHLKKSKL